MNKREFAFQRFYDLSSDIKSNIGSFTTLNTYTVLLLFLFWTFIFSMRQNKHVILSLMYTMKWLNSHSSATAASHTHDGN
ncbi:hypothetical protein [Bacillus subtilis]|uniref:hypothetical protein n=1 Tax=Bacillus stercoris TaxID=2054641 RepID=UPI0015B78CCF